jgi:hypothetical protein
MNKLSLNFMLPEFRTLLTINTLRLRVIIEGIESTGLHSSISL